MFQILARITILTYSLNIARKTIILNVFMFYYRWQVWNRFGNVHKGRLTIDIYTRMHLLPTKLGYHLLSWVINNLAYSQLCI